jgi:hypothetical protein
VTRRIWDSSPAGQGPHSAQAVKHASASAYPCAYMTTVRSTSIARSSVNPARISSLM